MLLPPANWCPIFASRGMQAWNSAWASAVGEVRDNGTLPYLALLLPFCPRLMSLLVVL